MEVSDNISSGQQRTYQQMMQESMNSYTQLLNNPPFYVSQQPLEEGKRATGQDFHQASERWMQLAQQQQRSLQLGSRALPLSRSVGAACREWRTKGVGRVGV